MCVVNFLGKKPLFKSFLGVSGRGTTRAEDAQGTPTHSHTPPSILVYEDKTWGSG